MYRLTTSFSEDESKIIIPMLERFLAFFPELEKRGLVVGRTASKIAAGNADVRSNRIGLPVDSRLCFQLIGHELTHLLQGKGRDIPAEEIQCDIWTFARDELFTDLPLIYLVSLMH